MPDKWRKAEVSSAVAITLFTLVLTVISIKQWCVATTAANAAKKSADAAFAGIRAWVIIQDWQVPEPDKVNAGIGEIVQNVGKTPALNLRINEDSFIWETGTPIPSYNRCPTSPVVAIGNAFPAGPQQPIPPRPLASPYDTRTIAKLRAHTAGLVLHGCLTYRTVGQRKTSQIGLTMFCPIFYTTADKDDTIGCAPDSYRVE